MDEAKLNEFLGKMVGDLGAAVSAALVLTGDKLGLYKTLAKDGPLSSEELASQSGTTERYVREWLAAQAASGYVEYDSDQNKFSMSPEQVAVFADDDSPVNMTGGFYSVAAVLKDEPKVTDAFRTGEGIGWGEHDGCLFCGTEKFFRPGYKANLTTSWIPALDGVDEKLKKGCLVADIGCGFGASTIVMAEAYPNSKFFGFDFHDPSIVHAREAAEKSGLSNVQFETVTAGKSPGSEYDLVAFFDCLHDMGNPVGAMSSRPRDPQARRDVPARRALCSRHPRRQPEPPGPGLLFLLHHGLHAECPQPGRGNVPGRPGRRGSAEEGGHGRGLHPVPASNGDAVQPDPRGAALIVIGFDETPRASPAPDVSAFRGRTESKRHALAHETVIRPQKQGGRT